MLKSSKFKNITNKPKAEILKKKKTQTNILTPGVLVKGPCYENIAVLYLCLFFFRSVLKKKKKRNKKKSDRCSV